MSLEGFWGEPIGHVRVFSTLLSLKKVNISLFNLLGSAMVFALFLA